MKVEKFNQIVKAIILTSIALLIIYGIGDFIISDLISSKRARKKKDVIEEKKSLHTSNYSQDTLSTEVVKKYITFYNPSLIDSLKQYYIFPVGHIDDKQKRKNSSSENRFAVDSPIRISEGFDAVDFGFLDYYHGVYNNFIFYNASNKSYLKIFDKKTVISDYFLLEKINPNIILFKGTQSDSNVDGLLNNDDFQSLFVYTIKEEKIKKYTFENKTILRIKRLEKSDKIILLVGVDKNKDAKFAKNKEPQEVIVFDTKNLTVSDLISEELMDEMQKQIELK